MKLTERQEQALRALRKIEARDNEARFKSAGQIAANVPDLPVRRQHGNGAKSKRSWSGSVPGARLIAPALAALVRLGLAEKREWWENPLDARSASYRLTSAGREKAREAS